MFENKSTAAKYIQLYNYYKELILNGIMKKDEKMPSIRTCSKAFSLSRTTVENAYELLAAEGYIISKPQSGFFVRSVDYSNIHRYAKMNEASGERKNKIKYDLVSSKADKASFNFSLWRRYVKSALRQDDRLLSYGEPQGEYDLRQAICEYISKERAVVCSPSQIVIAAGTQNLIGILCAITKERSKVAFVGSKFEQGKAVFEDYGKTVDLSASTLKKINDIDDLDADMIYTSPSHTDSWGSVLSLSDRMALLEYAKNKNCLIIEDDYDSEFRYYAKPLPSLQGMNGGQNVVYIGTFSKLLLPSIRISFMVLPLGLIENYQSRGGLYNQTASKAEQIALCQFIRDGHLASQLRKQKKQYASKTAFICEKAGETLPDNIRFEQCQASYLIRVLIRGKKSAVQICSMAEKLGVRMRAVGDENETAMILISAAGFDTENCDELFRIIKESV
ncbi:MAG: PLP-dependent aminotransferase family protein [Acutalibacteraceae bacterium]